MIKQQGVHKIFEGKKQTALIDNTDFNDVKVILTDTNQKYIQRFFVRKDFSHLLADTKTMREIGIPSL